MANDVKVETYIEHIDNLVHSDANPRFIKNKKHRELMDSLKEFPEMKLLREIVVDENMLILAGDKRVYALAELGYTEVTVKKVTGLTEAKKREFIAKDNIHNGEWDTDIIANQWDAEELEKWGMPKIKFGDDDGEKKEKKAAEHSHTHTCPECGAEFED